MDHCLLHNYSLLYIVYIQLEIGSTLKIMSHLSIRYKDASHFDPSNLISPHRECQMGCQKSIEVLLDGVLEPEFSYLAVRSYCSKHPRKCRLEISHWADVLAPCSCTLSYCLVSSTSLPISSTSSPCHWVDISYSHSTLHYLIRNLKRS
jgi:hypothetical protein